MGAYKMLTQNEIIYRAIAWRVIALYSESQSHDARIPYSKSNAYIDVLQLPYSRECGNHSQENLFLYANELLILFKKSEEKNINDFLTENINVTQWAII